MLWSYRCGVLRAVANVHGAACVSLLRKINARVSIIDIRLLLFSEVSCLDNFKKFHISEPAYPCSPMGCKYLIFMFPIDTNSGERQRKETQIIHCSLSSMAMLQTIGSSACIYESYLKTRSCKKIDFTKCHIQTKVFLTIYLVKGQRRLQA